jgi:hypothetical protein
MLRKIDFRRWLAIGTLVLLTSVVSLAKPKDKKGCGPHDNCVQAPDGGSTAAYLLIAGSSCLGAMAFRTRRNKIRV